jgi:hypothetical protein
MKINSTYIFKTNKILNKLSHRYSSKTTFSKLFNKKFSQATMVTGQDTNTNLNSLKIILPNSKQTEVVLDQNTAIEDLEKAIKKTGHYENIEFRTWDNSIISKSSSLQSCFGINNFIFLQIDKTEWQLLENPEDKINIVDKVNNNLDKYSYSKKIFDERNEISRLIKVLQDNNRNDLSYEELKDIALRFYSTKTSYADDIPEHLANRDLHDIFEEYYVLKGKHVKLTNQKEKIENRAKIYAKCLILVGGSFFVAQLALLYYGTFILWSWDITEPITYLVGCANLVLILFYRKRFGRFSAMEYYTKAFYRRVAKFWKFDDNELMRVKNRIGEIERFLN